MIQLIWIHFIADFVLQSDKMAINKSRSFLWLAFHCFVYACPFAIYGSQFYGAVFTSHLIIDFFSSKVTTYLWERNQRHWFFVTIGLDQALHLTILELLRVYL